jgi:membrane associated rhomboid family serine protease
MFPVLASLINFLLDPDNFRPLIRLLLITWTIHVLNWGIGQGAFNYVFGIRPRNILSLPGIVTSHFLHRGYIGFRSINTSAHIIANTAKFLSFGYPIVLVGSETFETVTIATALFSGIGTWLFGQSEERLLPPHAYVGSEGVIFGYIGFLFVYETNTGIDLSMPWTGPGRIVFIMCALVGIFGIFSSAIGELIKGILDFFGLTQEVLDARTIVDQAIDEAGKIVSETTQQQSLAEAIFEILLFRHPESVVWGFVGGLVTAYTLMLNNPLL